jgi:uncharacterized membrane protein YdjX (TVP38/TMEM64 family)
LIRHEECKKKIGRLWHLRREQVKASSTIRLIGIALLAAAMVTTLIFLPVKSYLDEFLEWIGRIGVWGPLLFGAVYILATVLFVPGSLFTLGAGFVFGVVVGTITVSLASTLGASAAFLVGRTLARDWVRQRIARSRRFQTLDEAIKRRGFMIVLLVRLSPVFPYNVLNYALGLTQVSFRDYVLASWIGMLPATVMYVYLGSTLKTLADLASGKIEGGVSQKVLFGIGLAATLAVTIVVTRLARNALKKTVPMQEEVRPEPEIHS